MTFVVGTYRGNSVGGSRLATRCATLLVLWMLAICTLGTTGCAVWQVEQSEPSELPIPKMSADSVSLEVAFLHVPTSDPLLQEPLWQAVDELHFPAPLRKQLAANGLRCGIVGTQLPLEWQQLIDSAEVAGGDSLTGDVHNVRRRMQVRSGKRNEIWTSKKLDKIALLMTNQDNQVVGKTFHQANCLFAMKSHAQGDGRVRLELVPELHYGDPKSEYVGQDGMFRLKVEREREIFSALRLEATLAAGQTVVISCSDDPTGLGKQFFTQREAEGEYRQFLLIRLAATQFDDLFAPVEQFAPIATPTE